MCHICHICMFKKGSEKRARSSEKTFPHGAPFELAADPASSSSSDVVGDAVFAYECLKTSSSSPSLSSNDTSCVADTVAAMLCAAAAGVRADSTVRSSTVTESIAPVPSVVTVRSSSTVTESIAPVPSDVTQGDVAVICETFTCAGGTWTGGNSFEPCMKKKMGGGIRHGRSQVCSIHHEFIKCVTCNARIHDGCHVRSTFGYSLPQRNAEWKCLECTLKLNLCQETSEPQSTAAQTSTADVDQDCVKKKETKCLFSNRQELLQHIRDTKWRIRSTAGNRCYFHCLTCKQRFSAKSLEDDVENGSWCAVNMPSTHECSSQLNERNPLTHRVCNLQIDVYKEIQQLSCCKAFKPASIQIYIKQKYGIIASTTLIYNIGYRARSKLGIADMERLLSHQQVKVYNFDPHYTLEPGPGTTRFRRHF